MKILGLTGPSGSGKSSCSAVLASVGIPTIDTDLVYHELIATESPCTKELVAAFGESILNENRSIDRKALASIVFSDSSHEKVERLNAITHKYVRLKTLALIDAYKAQDCPAVAVDAPLLFEAEFDVFCDFCISVLAPKEIRLSRIMKRDNITKEQAEARLSAQKQDDYYSARSAYTVINDSDVEKMNRQIREILLKEAILA